MFLDDFCFDKLIAPHSTAEFFETYFEKQPLVIKRNDPDYYEGLLTPKDLDQIFFHWPNDLSVVNASKDQGARKSMGGKVRQGSVQTVLKAMDEGDSIILDSLDQRHPPLTRLCAMLEIEHGWPYQTNIYITPGNAQGFRTHSDNHNVFILQTTGSKQWRVNQMSAPAEVLLDVDRKLEIDEANHLSFVLEEGDLVYIPRGFAHDATARDASSVHITLSPQPPSWRDALTYVMTRLVRQMPDVEKSLPLQYGGMTGDELARPLKQWLRKMSEVNLTEETQDFIEGKLESFRGVFFGALQRRIEADFNSEASVYVKNGELMVRHEFSDEACRVHTPRKKVDLPPMFRTQIEFCLSGRPFAAVDIPGMDADERNVLIDRLLAEGLIVETVL